MKFSKAFSFQGTVAIIFVAMLAGCKSWMYSDYGVSALKLDKDTDAILLKKAITKDANNTQGFVNEGCFDMPISGVQDTSCRQQRNAAVAVLLNASDDLCQSHLKTIFGNEAKTNIVTGTFATLFAGAATVASGEIAKSTLAALSGFSSAERSLINETVYKDMLVTAVTKKIREARAAKSTSIVPVNFNKTMDDYPMVLAIRDVMDYHYSCSFMYGLEKALDEGTQSGIDAKTARLEQEKHKLELYADTRKDKTNDAGFQGANARIKAIEAQLLNLINAGALAQPAPQVTAPSSPTP